MLYGKEWEEPEPTKDLNPAITCMMNASYHFGQGINKLVSALSVVEGTEFEKKLEKLVQDLEDMRCDVDFLTGRMERSMKK